MADTALQTGAPAPDFSLPSQDGTVVSLADFAGRKVVLYFYPRADTPGCTREANDFTEQLGAFEDAGAVVLGVSKDTPAKLTKFADKHGLGITLLSDAESDVAEAYGVWREKSMYGRTFMGLERATFLIGPDGNLARIWRNVKVKGHADAVLAAVRDL